MDAADEARQDGDPRLLTPRALSMRAWRRERLAAALDWPAAEDQARRDAPRAKRGGFDGLGGGGINLCPAVGGEYRACCR